MARGAGVYRQLRTIAGACVRWYAKRWH